MPRLAIVVVTFNSAGEIGACLDAVPAAARATAHEVIVVDNASADGTAALVRSRWPQMRVIDAGGNAGFSRANNLGIRASAGELCCCSTPTPCRPKGRSIGSWRCWTRCRASPSPDRASWTAAGAPSSPMAR